MQSSQTLELSASTEPRYSEIIGRPIDNTVMSTYMRCPSEALKAYWLNRRHGEGPPSCPIAYGSGWHGGMEAIYKAPECSENDLYEIGRLGVAEAWEDHGIEDDHRTFDRCSLEIKKHIKEYGLPWRQETKTVGWPANPMVEMSGEVPIPGARHPYAVKIDRLTVTGNSFGFDDHKTTSQDNKDFFRSFELDNQMMGYAVGGQLISGRVMVGARVRRHVIRTKDSVHDQRTISYSQARLIEWCKNFDRWMEKLEIDLEHWRHLQSKGMDPYEAADAVFLLNKWACHGRKYSSCSYVGVCALPPNLRGRALEDDFEVSVWNPLEVKGDVNDA